MVSAEDYGVEIGKKALVTVDTWFYAPDGKVYRAVFGTIRAIRTAQEAIGINPRPPSTNWYLEIGNMLIAGCQIHYAVRTDECNAGRVDDWSSDSPNGYREYQRPCGIYFADAAK